jgi:hypothetical protein
MPKTPDGLIKYFTSIKQSEIDAICESCAYRKVGTRHSLDSPLAIDIVPSMHAVSIAVIAAFWPASVRG